MLSTEAAWATAVFITGLAIVNALILAAWMRRRRLGPSTPERRRAARITAALGLVFFALVLTWGLLVPALVPRISGSPHAEIGLLVVSALALAWALAAPRPWIAPAVLMIVGLLATLFEAARYVGVFGGTCATDVRCEVPVFTLGWMLVLFGICAAIGAVLRVAVRWGCRRIRDRQAPPPSEAES